jgi:hypothetical protein
MASSEIGGKLDAVKKALLSGQKSTARGFLRRMPTER